jgi:hypothetical protein
VLELRSFRILSYNRSIELWTCLHRVRSSASPFSFHYTLVSLRSFSSCSRNLPRRPITSTISSIFPAMSSFIRQFLCKMWLIQLANLPFIVYRILMSSLTLCNLRFSHCHSTWSSPFTITTFQRFPDISDLLSEVSNLQYRTNLCSRYRILVVSSLNLSRICW